MKLITCCLLASLLSACSAKQGYQGAQSMEQSRCVNYPASEYQNCLQRSAMSYEEYESLRSTQNTEDGDSK